LYHKTAQTDSHRQRTKTAPSALFSKLVAQRVAVTPKSTITKKVIQGTALINPPHLDELLESSDTKIKTTKATKIFVK